MGTSIWWFGFHNNHEQALSTTVSSDPASPIAQLESPADAKTSEEGDVPSETPSGAFARRIVHVPPDSSSSANNESAYDGFSKLTPENLVAFSKYHLEAAMAGDNESAIRVSRNINTCLRTPKTIEGVEWNVNQLIQLYDEMQEEGQALPKSITSETKIRFENTAWYEACLQHDKISMRAFVKD